MSADIQEKKRFENQLKKFDQSLKERGLTPGSRKFAWAGVRSFFHAFDFDLRLDRADIPKGESAEVRAITKSEIRQLLAVVDLRTQALIYTLKDTGLRSSDLVRLNVGDVNLEAEYPMLQRRTKKRGIIAKTFLGPEAQRALKKYLTTRRYGTDAIPAETITTTSPLFRQDLVEVKRMTVNAITSHMWRQMAVAQLHGVSAHSFRRFYETALEAGGVSPNWVDRMIGHRLSGARGSYSKPTDAELRDAYIQAYDQLRVDEPAFDAERLARQEEQLQQERAERQRLAENVLRLTDENLTLRQQVQELRAEHDRIWELVQAIEQQVTAQNAQMRAIAEESQAAVDETRQLASLLTQQNTDRK
jgi:integrase